MPSSTLYSDLSHYYNLMCCDIDYREQCDFSHRLFHLLTMAATTPIRSLDLACGTGPHVEHFLSLGYNASGLDINAPMLTLAQARCPTATFVLQDMCNFVAPEPLSLITCFLYSMHYNYPAGNFWQTLQQAYNALETGGLFIFDMVDRDYIANDSGYTHHLHNSEGDFSFQSRWYDKKADDKLDLLITITKQNRGIKEQWQDQHTMLALNTEHVITKLQSIGFEVTVFERDYSRLKLWQKNVGNVILACIKNHNN